MSSISLASSLITVQAQRATAPAGDSTLARPVKPSGFTPPPFRVPGEEGETAPGREGQAGSSSAPPAAFRREAPLASERPAYQRPGANLDITI
ncbi:MAG: hypothetical protein GC199_00360 [Alphaproteobacteria bacterium]|nr:hypothetical protein [Alphaproteobacteria bacterium]